MGRKLQFPQMADLQIGQQFRIPLDEVKDAQAVRNAASKYGDRSGTKLTVAIAGSDILVMRIARTREEFATSYAIERCERYNLDFSDLKHKIDGWVAARMKLPFKPLADDEY